MATLALRTWEKSATLVAEVLEATVEEDIL
jgi:hypothetical protein